MNISYRKLAPDNSKQYRAIRLESLRLHPESFGADYEEQSALPKLMFEKAIEEPVDERFVMGAIDEGDLIGICGFIPFVLYKGLELTDAGTIIQMYVKAAYRGRKIGLGLVKAVVEEAFKLPEINQIVLGVMTGNKSAIRVYEQAGFEKILTEGGAGGLRSECDRMMIRRRED